MQQVTDPSLKAINLLAKAIMRSSKFARELTSQQWGYRYFKSCRWTTLFPTIMEVENGSLRDIHPSSRVPFSTSMWPWRKSTLPISSAFHHLGKSAGLDPKKRLGEHQGFLDQRDVGSDVKFYVYIYIFYIFYIYMYIYIHNNYWLNHRFE